MSSAAWPTAPGVVATNAWSPEVPSAASEASLSHSGLRGRRRTGSPQGSQSYALNAQRTASMCFASPTSPGPTSAHAAWNRLAIAWHMRPEGRDSWRTILERAKVLFFFSVFVRILRSVSARVFESDEIP